MQKIKEALAFTAYFFTELVPQLLNANMGAIGELFDAIGYAKIIATAIAIAIYILIQKFINRD